MERVVEGATGGMAGSGQGGTALKLRSLWFNAEHRLERF
ncbi:transcriptional regulator [Pseudomonas protegens]|nr:transcriptional regulator [Pseudomonas protegens]